MTDKDQAIKQFSVKWGFGGLFASMIEPIAYMFELLSLVTSGRPEGIVKAIRNVDYGMFGKEYNEITGHRKKVKPIVYTYFGGRVLGYTLYGYIFTKIFN